MDLRGKSYVGLKLQTFAYFVYNASCAVSRCLGRFLLSVFLDAFPFDLTLSFTSISPQFDGVRLRVENFPRIQWAIFVASRSRVRTLCFICRRHDPVDSCFDEVRKAFKTLGVEISGFIFAWISRPQAN